MRAKVIKLRIMSKNKRHNDLKMKCKKTRTAHSQDRCVLLEKTKTNVKDNGVYHL